MKITFEGQTLQHVVAEIGDFLKDLTTHDLAAPGPTSSDREPSKEPRKRGRRTKSKSTETSESAPATSETTKKPGGRRGSKSSPAPTEEAAPKSARGRRSKAGAKSPSDVKDSDLAKAASGLAEATNPQFVLDLLEQFGVAGIQELEGDARREFLGSVAELMEAE